MSQIFVSHSSKDHELLSLIWRAFAATHVRGVFEEFEAITKGPATSSRIATDIRHSNATFIVLSTHVENLKHTRDWISWESGVAASAKRPIWVIEPVSELTSLFVVVPQLTHYLCVDNSDASLSYLIKIITLYDTLTALIQGSTTENAVLWKAILDCSPFSGIANAVTIAQDKSKRHTAIRALGMPFTCLHCRSTYNVHQAPPERRCPVCNYRYHAPHLHLAQ